MKSIRAVGIVLALAIAACGAPGPTGGGGGPAAGPNAPDGQAYPGGNPYRTLAVEELPIVGVTTDSAQSGLVGARAIDGDLSTQWSNGGYRNATAWVAVQLAQSATIASVAVKTGPMPAGTTYDVQVSADGAAWSTVATGLTNATWGLETKALPAATSGRHVRIFWHNSASAPQAHFAVYELAVNGQAGAAPSPTPTATPTASPTAAPTATPTPVATPTPGGAVGRLSPTGATASSVYSGLVAGRAIDGNGSTQWSNGGYREAEAWLQLSFAEPHSFDHVAMKTGALPAGVRFVIETSDDGSAWRAASGELTIATWNMETRPVSGSGRHLRVRFLNSAASPVARFQLFELEAYGAGGGGGGGGGTSGNRAPVVSGVTADRYKSPQYLTAEASDPDGDALSYSWARKDGTVFGTERMVRYYNGNSGDYGPYDDEDVVLTVRDGHGGETRFDYRVDNFGGEYTQYPASSAAEWDPSKVGYASLTGDVTVRATGDFAAYSAVIVEYNTASGRVLALAAPGDTTLPGCTGAIYMYLLGPVGPDSPKPSITLTLTSGGQAQTRTITQAQVAGSNHQGFTIGGGPGSPGITLGEHTARNGDRPYPTMLSIFTSGYANPADDPGGYAPYSIGYRLIHEGETMWGVDNRYCYGDCDSRLIFTDSKGGAADNTGYWGLYEIYIDPRN